MPPRKAAHTRSTAAAPPPERSVPRRRAAQRRQPSGDDAERGQDEPQTKRHDLAQTETISLVPPSSNFHTVLRLFFHSDHWVLPLRADVDALLSAFEQRWAARTGEEGPVQVMKTLWSETGWKWVLLLGCPEGPLRRVWGQTVVRAFVEHLTADVAPLRQVAAFFALYLLTQTQAKGAEKLFIRVDPPTLDYILSLPERLASSLDAALPPEYASPTPTRPPPSADISFVLSIFLQTSSFQLTPFTSTHAWPFVHVERNAKRLREKRERALLVLGAEEELERIGRGDVDGTDAHMEKGKKRQRREGGTAGEDAANGLSAARDGGGWLTKRLEDLSSVYTQAKTIPFAGVSTSSDGPPLPSRLSTITQPATPLQASILERAKAMMRGRLQELAMAEADANDLLDLVAKP